MISEKTTESASQTLNRRVTAGLVKIGLALRTHARAGANERGLSPTQGEILAFLLRKSGASLSEVADELGVTRPTVSDAIDTLVRKRLVEKNRSVLDPRALSLLLTPKGQREARRAAAWPDGVLAAVDQLSPQEQEAWLSGLIRMLEHLRSTGDIHALRLCTNCSDFEREAQPGSAKPHACKRTHRELADSDIEIDCPNHRASNGA